MTDLIRFHLDENVDPVIAAALRRYGIDVTTTVEIGLRTTDDKTQFDFVKRENRVVVTHDDDFLRISSQNPDHPGIAFCHMEARSIGEMIRALHLIYEVLTPEDMVGHIEYL